MFNVGGWSGIVKSFSHLNPSAEPDLPKLVLDLYYQEYLQPWPCTPVTDLVGMGFALHSYEQFQRTKTVETTGNANSCHISGGVQRGCKKNTVGPPSKNTEE